MGAFDLFRVRARFLCCVVSSPAAAPATLWRAKLRVIYAKGQMDFLGKSSPAECSKCHHRLGLVHPSNCVCKKRVQFLAPKKCTALARISQPWNFENWKYVNAKNSISSIRDLLYTFSIFFLQNDSPYYARISGVCHCMAPKQLIICIKTIMLQLVLVFEIYIIRFDILIVI